MFLGMLCYGTACFLGGAIFMGAPDRRPLNSRVIAGYGASISLNIIGATLMLMAK